MSLNVVILAAGKGTRMRSSLPKVLHPVANKPMVSHVIDTARQIGAEQLHLVYGHGAELLKERIVAEDVNWVLQAQQLGTGHAVAQAIPFWNDEDDVLVLYGDTPLIQPETLQRLLAAKASDGMALLTVVLDNPTGYGRIVRSNGQVVGIVEQKDANAEQLAIREVNTGVLVANGGQLRSWLSRLDNKNAQGEFYLTDVIAMAHGDGCAIAAVHPDSYNAFLEQTKQDSGAKGKGLFQPLRAALTGRLDGPELAKVYAIMEPHRLRMRLAEFLPSAQ